MQRNEIAYIGICGGGTLAGTSTTFVQTAFDLLPGARVHYQDGVSAKQVTHVMTSVDQDVVHFTTGCAIAILFNTASCRAMCFPTTKTKHNGSHPLKKTERRCKNG